ncbi:MAG: YdiY family protein [Pseudomonadota bacterium]
MKRLLTGGVLLLFVSAAVAADWSGDVELGAVMTTGNTDQQNLKFSVGVTSESVLFKHAADLDGLRSSENSMVTAQRLFAAYQADYKLEGDHSLFGRLSYEDDRFSGFDYQTDATIGYSRLLMQRTNMTLRGDVGGGMRRSELATGGGDSEFITRLAAFYTWDLSETSQFSQKLSTEIGADNTISRSETSLASQIAGALAMKLTLLIKNQSEVPLGRKKTDTETSVTLVYNF